jgi:dihydrofolate reductase
MRNIILLMHTSLDGFVADPKGDMRWINHDEEIFAYVSSYIEEATAALYGRVTYQMMESYWPQVGKSPKSTQRELHHARWVEQVEKIVASTSLERVTWNNARLVKNDLPTEIKEIKQGPGKYAMIFGSPRLTHSLMALGLIDEYLIQINPIILGRGIPLFDRVETREKLTLLQSKTFSSGVVGLHYQKQR